MRFVGFIGPSYTLGSVNQDCQRCVNLYPEMDALGTGKEREVASLVSTPGLTSLVTLPTSPVRGVWTASNGTLYAVGGSVIYSVSSAWVATSLGSLQTASGAVSMADNGLQLVIVDGTAGYYVTLSNNVLATIVDGNFLNGTTSVAFLDDSFIFNKPNSSSFFCSDLLAVTFSGTNTEAKESYPDNLVGLVTAQENLFLFGSQSLEVWYDAGTTPCPFARIQGAALRVGCAAAGSIAVLQNIPYWIGGDKDGQGVVYSMNGYQPQRISTPAVEASIRSVGSTNVSGATAWTYQQGGHLFYCLNVPGLSYTWVYDASTSLWHERTYLGSFGFERHRVSCSSLAYGINVAGDYVNGKIYSIDASNYTDNGVSIVRMRTAPHLTKDLNRIFHSKIQLDMETGVGLSGTGQGTAPQAMLQWSDDGGHSWSNEHWNDIGPVGATRTRVIWRRLGTSRDRVYRVMISDPVKVTLLGVEIETEEGAA